MRQILLNTQSATVARMPRPATAADEVLARTQYSLISTGTELASLHPGDATADASMPILPQVTVSDLGSAICSQSTDAHRLSDFARPHRPRPNNTVGAICLTSSTAAVYAGHVVGQWRHGRNGGSRHSAIGTGRLVPACRMFVGC